MSQSFQTWIFKLCEFLPVPSQALRSLGQSLPKYNALTLMAPCRKRGQRADVCSAPGQQAQVAQLQHVQNLFRFQQWHVGDQYWCPGPGHPGLPGPRHVKRIRRPADLIPSDRRVEMGRLPGPTSTQWILRPRLAEHRRMERPTIRLPNSLANEGRHERRALGARCHQQPLFMATAPIFLSQLLNEHRPC